jgi:branched-chain amino acid aminotransferase
MEAAAQGYQQILWLLGSEHTLTEAGTMNLFLVFKKEDGSTFSTIQHFSRFFS